MSALVQNALAAIGGAAVVLLALRLRRPRAVEAAKQLPPLKYDNSWDPETARLAYQDCRELYSIVDHATDVIDRKVVAVFTVSSAIAVLGPVLGRFPLWSAGWWLSAGAVVMWGATAVGCWLAFKPRGYRSDPDPAAIATPDWLGISPGAYHAHRLKSLGQSIEVNLATVTARARALQGALTFALLEVACLLVALLWR